MATKDKSEKKIKADKYNDIDYPLTEDTFYGEYTINNTTINIDKTVKRIFNEVCKEHGISMYKALNILIHDFFMEDKGEVNMKMFTRNYKKKERSLAETMTIVTTGREGKRMKNYRYPNEKEKRTIRIQTSLYSEVAQLSRRKKNTVQESLVIAVTEWLDKG